MKRYILLVFLAAVILLTICSCYQRGPYPAPIHQPLEDIIKIDIVDGRNELELYYRPTYQVNVIYTLKPEEIAPFVEGLQVIEFYKPGFEPARDLGYFGIWIYYKDGNSDLIGTICNKYLDSEGNYLLRGIDNPDDEAFYALVEQYVDPALLPRSWD